MPTFKELRTRKNVASINTLLIGIWTRTQKRDLLPFPQLLAILQRNIQQAHSLAENGPDAWKFLKEISLETYPRKVIASRYLRDGGPDLLQWQTQTDPHGNTQTELTITGSGRPPLQGSVAFPSAIPESAATKPSCFLKAVCVNDFRFKHVCKIKLGLLLSLHANVPGNGADAAPLPAWDGSCPAEVN